MMYRADPYPDLPSATDLLTGRRLRLRSVEPYDAELLLRWENDPQVWPVSGTERPYTREEIEAFVAEEQQADIYRNGQQRWMIECFEGRGGRLPNGSEDAIPGGRSIGAIDLFDFDPEGLRAGVGILVYSPADRRRGYAAEALALLETYVRILFGLQEIWCHVHRANTASLALFRRAGYVASDPDAAGEKLFFRKRF